MPRINAALALFVSALFGQPATTRPTFEVASIKPTPVALGTRLQAPRGWMTINPARLDIGSASLEMLISMAYRVESYQISGPDWIDTERFDVQAKIPGDVNKEQVPQMLQELLAERFKLVIHRESKQRPVYALLVAKSGPNLKRSAIDPTSSDEPFPDSNWGSRIPQPKVGHTPGRWWTYSMPNGVITLDRDAVTLPKLTRALMPFLDVPIIDMTELKGTYQISTDVPAVSPGDSILGLLEKLGLRLERRKAQVEYLMVDHLEKAPTEN
jgi:uncharacterized protein (TIGR03435 family)